jgi:hypothetical protein
LPQFLDSNKNKQTNKNNKKGSVQMQDLNKLVVRADGLVDVSETLEKIESELNSANAAAEKAFAAVGPAVDAVFAKHPGAAINMPAVVSFTLAELATGPEKFQETSELVTNYIRANSTDGGKYEIRKGKGGGVRLRTEPAAAAE